MGECRRYPRMIVYQEAYQKEAYQNVYHYSNVADFDWCGEWKPSKELQVLLDKYSKEEL